MDTGTVRIDKWLWAARVYKTRGLAAEACRAGHVTINGQRVKPSHSVKLGEILSVQAGSITKTFRVLGLLDKRVGAPLAKDYAEDITPPSEYEKLKAERAQPCFRYEGLGRPTKKDRREMGRVLKSSEFGP